LVAPGLASAETANKLHQAAKDSSVTAQKKVSDRLLTSFKDEEKVTFLVKFKEKADTQKVAASAKESADQASLSSQKSLLVQRSAVVSELKETSMEEQQNVTQFLEQELEAGNVEEFDSYFIVNGMSVTATKE